MTDQEINIAIAEKCGWRIVRERGCATTVWNPDGTFAGLWTTHNIIPIPDYCSDLNAMHEAEKTIVGTSTWGAYHCWIVCVLDAFVDSDLGCDSDLYIHATARQRAEAFLLTFNLWRD